MHATVIAVASRAQHRFSKTPRDVIRVLAGFGVEGDAHAGATVKHRSRRKKTPQAPNLRQIHLLHAELFEDLAHAGFAVGPAELGENVTTRGIDLLSLARGTSLRLGAEVIVELTGLRNPCIQIDRNIGAGAMAATLGRATDGTLIRKTGVMAVVLAGGEVRPGDGIKVEYVPSTRSPLERV
jgi:MOSC domain-containing protein YiiM